CSSVAAGGTTSTNSRSTGAPSTASKSTGASRRSTALIGALQFGNRQCGMAMPLPKPVEPRRSRAISASNSSLGSSPGCSRAIRLAISSRTRFLLPPGAFTWERPGVRMLSSRIMELESADGGALLPVEALLLGLDQLAVELVHQQVDGGIHVGVLRIGDHFAAGDVQGGLDLLLQLLH